MARSYIVTKGDTLGKIAKRELDDAGLVTLIAAFNGIRAILKIFVGQQLEIPTKKDRQPQAPPAGLKSGFNIAPPHGLDNIVQTFGDIFDYIRDDGTLDQRRLEYLFGDA
jgi:LysM repeat protein